MGRAGRTADVAWFGSLTLEGEEADERRPRLLHRPGHRRLGRGVRQHPRQDHHVVGAQLASQLSLPSTQLDLQVVHAHETACCAAGL